MRQAQDKRGVARPELDWSHFPKKAEGVIGERIGRLEKPEREILEAACVEGDGFTAEVVATVLGRDPREIVRDLGKLDREQGLVSSTGIRRVGQQRLSSYVFRHHLVQQYLYQATDAPQRAYLHEDVAKALVTLYGDQDEEIWGPLAIHYRSAGDADLALHYSVLAGDRASRLYANADAVAHYTTALDLLPKVAAGSDQLIHLSSTGPGIGAFRPTPSSTENYQEWKGSAAGRTTSPNRHASRRSRSSWRSHRPARSGKGSNKSPRRR
jgi:hypothetical protein